MQQENKARVLFHPARRRRGLVKLGAVAAAATAMAASGPQDGASRIDEVRSVLEQWVEVRKTISREKRDWQVGKDMLNHQCGLVRREIESLRTRQNEALASIAETDKKRDELVRESEVLASNSSALAETVVALEARTRALLPRLPEPLRERVKPLSQRLPEAQGATKLSLAERFQNVVGILNEANKFQREISITSEVRALPNGTSAEVSTMYIGVGQAFFASANGSVAGRGSGAGGAWTWKQDDAAARDIQRAIAIQRNEQVAGFVPLGIEIQ
ncbi:MAG: DUF3450 family protein [Planctomycetes bacterium]|nr:DUF3450 family protein [Planctomycetota bacterium]